MKYVKCDKCGVERKIDIVKDDYLCNGSNDQEIFFIKEIYIKGNSFDVCRNCYNRLEKAKSDIDDIFLRSIQKESNKSEEEKEYEV